MVLINAKNNKNLQKECRNLDMKSRIFRYRKFPCLLCLWVVLLLLVYLNQTQWKQNRQNNDTLSFISNRSKSSEINSQRGVDQQIARELSNKKEEQLSFDQLLYSDYQFRQESSDVIVFFHIQKTGGSYFSESLALFLNVSEPCQCDEDSSRICDCPRPGSERLQWLFSWHSVDWVCGLHPALTWLKQCIPGKLDNIEGVKNANRRYLYITLLRDPVSRYLSEFLHKKNKGGWGVVNWCEGRAAFQSEIELCPIYKSHIVNLTMGQFLDCRSNQANNRQTMMLADLHLVNCYNRTGMSPQERSRILLQSAKANLRKMAFFAISEMQRTSQLVFEKTFRLAFTDPFRQFNHTRAGLLMKQLTAHQMDRIRQLNSLDIQLYKFATTLLKQRAQLLGVDIVENNDI